MINAVDVLDKIVYCNEELKYINAIKFFDGFYEFKDAEEAIKEFCSHNKYKDWRLPKETEAKYILKHKEFIESVLLESLHGSYWTSTFCHNYGHYGYRIVDIYTGIAMDCPMSKSTARLYVIR